MTTVNTAKKSLVRNGDKSTSDESTAILDILPDVEMVRMLGERFALEAGDDASARKSVVTLPGGDIELKCELNELQIDMSAADLADVLREEVPTQLPHLPRRQVCET